MKNVKGWFMPEWDNHYLKMMKEYDGKFEYQKDTRDYSLRYVKNFNFALDIGGNIGFWSQDLCRKFKKVLAFEPHPENILCYKENMKDFDNWNLEEVALSNQPKVGAELFSSPDECGNVSLISHGVETGSSERKLSPKQLNKVLVDVKTLDSYELEDIGFMKVDCQGHEFEIVLGAQKTLKKNNMVLCLELPKRNKEEIEYHDQVVKFLNNIGYRRQGNMRKETIFTK